MDDCKLFELSDGEDGKEENWKGADLEAGRAGMRLG